MRPSRIRRWAGLGVLALLACVWPQSAAAQLLAAQGDHFTVDAGDGTGPHAKFLVLTDYTDGVEAKAPWADMAYLKQRLAVDGIRVRPDWTAGTPGGLGLKASPSALIRVNDQGAVEIQGDHQDTAPADGTLRKLLDVVELAMSQDLIVDLSVTRRRADGAIDPALYQAALVRLTQILKPYGHVLIDVQEGWDAPLATSDPSTPALTPTQLGDLVDAIHREDPERMLVASSVSGQTVAGVSAAAYHQASDASTLAATGSTVAAWRSQGLPIYVQAPPLWLGAAGACGGAPGDATASDFVSAVAAARTSGAAAWLVHTCVSQDLRTTTLQAKVRGEAATRALLEMPANGLHTAFYDAAHGQAWGVQVMLTVAWGGRGRGTVTGEAIDCGVGVRDLPSTQHNRGTVCQVAVNRGGSLTLGATPDTAGNRYFTFQGWDVAGCGTNASCTVGPLTDDRTVTALFGYTPPPEMHYYHLDALGSVRVVTDAAGRELARHDFLPFGEELSPTPTQARLFTGKERDVESGLDYFGARYYRAHAGRFTTVDPELHVKSALADPQAWNRYSYAGNNPLRYVDPDGRYKADVHWWMTWGLAQAVGYTKSQAATIANADENVDIAHNPTEPFDVEGRASWHFPSDFRLAQVRGFAPTEQVLGENLHVIQDSYSHGSYGARFGHFWTSTPDITGLNEENLGQALRMARDTFETLKKNHGSSNAEWKDVQPFVLKALSTLSWAEKERQYMAMIEYIHQKY
jgi:RHS repeat-associated protein